MSSARHAFFLGATLVAALASPAASAGDVDCRISQRAVQKFADFVFPMTIKGTKSLGGAGLGASIAGSIAWKATISKPRLTITRDARLFESHAVVEAAGINWTGTVKGKLAIEYIAKTRQLVVKVQDAIVPLNLGLVKVDVDVSQDVPPFIFNVALPEVMVPDSRTPVRINAAPAITFEDGAVVLSSDVDFTKVGR